MRLIEARTTYANLISKQTEAISSCNMARNQMEASHRQAQIAVQEDKEDVARRALENKARASLLLRQQKEDVEARASTMQSLLTSIKLLDEEKERCESEIGRWIYLRAMGKMSPSDDRLFEEVNLLQDKSEAARDAVEDPSAARRRRMKEEAQQSAEAEIFRRQVPNLVLFKKTLEELNNKGCGGKEEGDSRQAAVGTAAREGETTPEKMNSNDEFVDSLSKSIDVSATLAELKQRWKTFGGGG
eukprot:GHVS01024941.1.p1 GENE.GHVS01024941.1~~GHVS01024941.1.p1  ORF type:complete len:244 (-),score=50.75 GHVS01024941.1:189-920(-)